VSGGARTGVLRLARALSSECSGNRVSGPLTGRVQLAGSPAGPQWRNRRDAIIRHDLPSPLAGEGGRREAATG
jgi:hypothetical protein